MVQSMIGVAIRVSQTLIGTTYKEIINIMYKVGPHSDPCVAACEAKTI